MKALVSIAWIAARELIFERVLYLLLGFAVLCVGLSLMLGQLTYAEQQKLTVDLLLGTLHLAMVLFAVFMGVSLFQKELTSGSIAMVLSKPIPRSAFVIGKFIGQSVIQFVVVAFMTTLICLLLIVYDYGSAMPVIQAGSLIYLEITVLTAITYFFAVNSGAVTTTAVVTCLFALGHLRSAITEHVSRSASEMLWTIVCGLIPNLEIFNTKDFASYGFLVPAEHVAYAALYAMLCIVFFLVASSLCFERKDIPT